MHYEEYLFTKNNLAQIEAITGNKFPYVNLRGTDDILYYYRTHTKQIVEGIVTYLDTINVDLYAHAVDYLTFHKNPDLHPTLLHFIAIGIKKNRIDVNKNYEFLLSIFNVQFTSVSKVYFDSKLFILQCLIEKDITHMDKFTSLVQSYNIKHGFTNDKKKELSNFLHKNLSYNTITQHYPQLLPL